MGCKNSKARDIADGVRKDLYQEPKRSNSLLIRGKRKCHFCANEIPQEQFNQHTVACDEREVTCGNSWCRIIIKQGELGAHMHECEHDRTVYCVKCGVMVKAREAEEHREMCLPIQCEQCRERVIPRLKGFCPVRLLEKNPVANVGPFAKKPFEGMNEPNRKVALLQSIWRWTRARVVIEDVMFRLIYKEMDLKKEGFAIFKAHDKDKSKDDGSAFITPRKSRSILQPGPIPQLEQDHYFPASSAVPITENHVRLLVGDIANDEAIPYAVAWRIFDDAVKHLNALPNIVRITPPVGAREGENGRWMQGGKTVLVGDIHGQVHDLLHIIQENGFPNEGCVYVFNGDFVDRGPHSVECLILLYAMMLAFPKYVTLNRGNHECDYMGDEYGFDAEVATKYDRNMFKLIQKTFCALPLATTVGRKVFVVHGGIPRRRGIRLSDIDAVQRFRQIPMPEQHQSEEDEIFQDLVWSDPWDRAGWKESDRGAGVLFGRDVTEDFLKLNGLEVVIRSHEEYMNGYEIHHGGKVVTVFSASNYDGPDTNKGAYATLAGDSTELSYHTYQIQDFDIAGLGEAFGGTPIGMGTPHMSTRRMDSVHGFSFTARMSMFLPNVEKIRRSKEIVLRVLRERIYQRRHRLMAYFSKLDRTHKGTVWKTEWVEVMRNGLNIDLPWYFLRRFIAEEDPFTHRINFTRFLTRYRNLTTTLWVQEWEQQTAKVLSMQLKDSRRSMQLRRAFKVDTREPVNYNEFCTFIRTVDHTLSDENLFQLWVHFDADRCGFIHGKIFVDEINALPEGENPTVPPIHVRWELDAMEQLQRFAIRGRAQLDLAFKVKEGKVGDNTLRSHAHRLNLTRFKEGMTNVNRSLKRPLSEAQQEALFSFIGQGSSEVHYDDFIDAFSIHDATTEELEDESEMMSSFHASRPASLRGMHRKESQNSIAK